MLQRFVGKLVENHHHPVNAFKVSILTGTKSSTVEITSLKKVMFFYQNHPKSCRLYYLYTFHSISISYVNKIYIYDYICIYIYVYIIYIYVVQLGKLL